MVKNFRYDVVMFYLPGVVFVHWQWILMQRALRASLEIMLFLRIILVWSLSLVESGLHIEGNIYLGLLTFSFGVGRYSVVSFQYVVARISCIGGLQ